ncbi:MAG: class I SAM-dependent methyltransferase [Candidatus Kerfeldbacteria bacterium]|nr:class I SAM-dependent methyltransferase [Candidatus Kerfeldbacteria bacterium]
MDYKIKLATLIQQGCLISPCTTQRLHYTADRTQLISADGQDTFPLHDNSVPVILPDATAMANYAATSRTMNREYSSSFLANERRGVMGWLRSLKAKDYRSPAAITAINRLLDSIDDTQVAIAIGGGPHRHSEKLLNLNIGPFPNVDIVGDAHALPLADNTVDMIECSAVLEHLHTPERAVSEMYRVCKPGAKLFVATPFVQSYHGYPYHYQNYTVTGHTQLFEQAGFKIIEQGACVGPTYTIMHLTLTYLMTYPPKILRLPLTLLWGCIMVLLKPLDIILNKRTDAHLLASTTYLVATK